MVDSVQRCEPAFPETFDRPSSGKGDKSLRGRGNEGVAGVVEPGGAMAEIITGSLWETITAAAKATKTPSFAASAYFGRGAENLLPLRAESLLVVDASIPTVQQGATCPEGLIRLQ